MWPPKDLLCYICGSAPPWDSTLRRAATNETGNHNIEGWGCFIEKMPHPRDGGVEVGMQWLCPAHSNVVAVETHRLRRYYGLPTEERNHNGIL